MKQSRMDFNQQILVMIDNNPSSMHREYNDFYAVHVYLRSMRISLTLSPFYAPYWAYFGGPKEEGPKNTLGLC